MGIQKIIIINTRKKIKKSEYEEKLVFLKYEHKKKENLFSNPFPKKKWVSYEELVPNHKKAKPKKKKQVYWVSCEVACYEP